MTRRHVPLGLAVGVLLMLQLAGAQGPANPQRPTGRTTTVVTFEPTTRRPEVRPSPYEFPREPRPVVVVPVQEPRIDVKPQPLTFGKPIVEGDAEPITLITQQPKEKEEQPKNGKERPKGDDSGLIYPIQLTPPEPKELFRIDSESALRDRLRKIATERGYKHTLEFPESPPSGVTTITRPIVPHQTMVVEPSYSISKRLFFEQECFERYGQSLGVFQPGVSAGIFVVDGVLLPFRWAAHPFHCYQINTDCYSPYFSRVGH